jgi:putative DNA primase/helicase
MDFISKFVTAMVNSGIVPKSTHDIAPSDRFKRIAQTTDRASKRSISYWLKLERDFAYGYAHDFKTGQEVRWNSAIDDDSLTKADISRIKAMMKARQLNEDIKTAERHAKIAQRSKRIWESTSPTQSPFHPYLEKKSIPITSAKILNKNLIIPIYEQNPKSGALEIVSLQTIYPCGKKRFPFGGKKRGCFHVIGQIDPTKPIIICEGWATGVSLHLALNQGIVVAFDAYNLLPVAKALRGYYKTTHIIIAADNDPTPHFTGQAEAKKVQKKVPDVTIIMPPQSGTDFNDLLPEQILSVFGLQAQAAGDTSLNDSQSLTASPPPMALDWQSNYILDGKNRLVATSLQNAILTMLCHHDFQGVFAYDEFKQDTILAKCPPWAHEKDFIVESVNDIAITQAAATLERYGINCTIEKCAKAIDVVAQENKFHSAREYIGGLEWDGVIRLETLAQDFMGTTEESPEYLAFIFKKWLTAAVKRIFEPACKFDHVLILEGQAQGLYKSQFFQSISTFNGERYYTDAISIADIGQKDTIMKMQGKIVVELSELSGFGKKEDGLIKNFITQTNDEIRIPFARKIINYPRQFVFGATTNEYDYLKDPSGNRRYWPLTVGKPIDIDGINEVKDMLWAEALYYYRSGLYIGPTPDENALAEFEREKRLQDDAWEDDVLKIALHIQNPFRVADIVEKMNLKSYEKNEATNRRVAKILKQNKYENYVAWNAALKKPVRIWRKNA